MEWLKATPPVDAIAMLILLGALVRGLFRGLIGEAFSIGALAAGCVAVRYAATPTAEFLMDWSGGALSGTVAPWIAAAMLGIAAVAAVAIAGRVVKKGANAAGLGLADRIGGAALGAAEGALVAGVLLFAAIWFLGREHPMLAESRSLAAFDQLQRAVGAPDPASTDVAAPPPIYRK